MPLKATFRCSECENEEEFPICSICHGAIDFPHQQNPRCKKCGAKMQIQPETIKGVSTYAS